MSQMLGRVFPQSRFEKTFNLKTKKKLTGANCYATVSSKVDFILQLLFPFLLGIEKFFSLLFIYLLIRNAFRILNARCLKYMETTLSEIVEKPLGITTALYWMKIVKMHGHWKNASLFCQFFDT